MRRFLVDEDVPRSTVKVLTAAGYEAKDVRDVGLSGHSDADVFAYAQVNAAILVSCDKGFASLLRFHLVRMQGSSSLGSQTNIPLQNSMRNCCARSSS